MYIFKKINGNLSNCATICFDKKEDNLFSLNINNFNEEKKNIHVHVLAINTHVFLLKYMFIKFKIETLMNE